MQKKVPSLLILLLTFTASFAQNGWRPAEMEVKVYLNSIRDGHILEDLHLETESASPDGSLINAYVTPSEMEKIRSSGLKFKVTITDLNDHYRNFWTDKLVPPGYYTYGEIVAIADSLAANFPSICKKVIYGTSVGGRQLAALKISDNVNVDENQPEIMFDGGIHGNEIGGSQNLIMYARDLCKGYGNNPTYTDLINKREIWIYYMVNPDGRVNMSRYNDNMVDCNRDFGYMWNADGNSTSAFSQPESKALRQCFLDNQFVVYTNYHSGSEVIAYPWSYRESAPLDIAHINQLASVYSASSGYTYLIYGQGNVIMYAINGSTKDFQYGCFGNVGWTIEISNNQTPPSTEIMTYYTYNVPAMTEMINRAGYGVEGVVTDSITGNPVPAVIWVSNYYPVLNDPVVGDYHKYVLPNNYTIKVTANGYKTKTAYNVVVPSTGSVTANFQLVPENQHHACKVLSCQIPGNNFDDPGFTPGAMGPPDNVPYAIGRSGWIVLDMGDTIYNTTGKDLKVFEAGGENRKYLCFAGTSMDGPWQFLGTGTGTTEFNLTAGSVDKTRYIKITDDGDGPNFGLGVGFNLDAIQMLCNVSVNLGNDTTIAPGASILLDAGNTGCSYLWSTGATTQKITVDSAGFGLGPHAFSVIVTKTPSCFSSDEIIITFDYPINIPGKDIEKYVTIFPNPSPGIMELEIHHFPGGKYRLFSPIGEAIMENNIPNDSFKAELNLTGYHAGIYFIEIFDLEKHITRKLIIE